MSNKVIPFANLQFDQEFPINGRDLHMKLEVKTLFKDWIVRMIEYGFEEGKDFCSFLSESTGGRPAKEYQLTIDMAKHICMIQRSEIGKKIRQYFIEAEKQWRQKQERPMTLAEITLRNCQAIVDHETKLAEHDQKIAAVEDKQDKQHGEILLHDVMISQANERLRDCEKSVQKLVAKSKNVPDEYAPVDVVQRLVVSKAAGALAVFLKDQGIYRSTAIAQNKIKQELIVYFQETMDINLLQELEAAKKWYQFQYTSAKTAGQSVANVLKPGEIKKLSLFALISTNVTWVYVFQQFMNEQWAKYRPEETEEEETNNA